MKKVCHVTSVHSSKDDRIFHKECLSLAKEYEVYLIAPNVSEEVDGDVHILGVPLPEGRFSKLFALGAVYRKALEVDASVYHFHDPELMFIGLKLKRKGKKIIFDSHEDVPQQIFTKEYLPSWTKKPLSLLYAAIERCCLKHYDALISVTPSIVERLETINSNTIMVTNYPSIRDMTVSRHNASADTDYVCFAGGVSQQYMHEYILDALRYTKVRYLLAGPAYPSYFERLKSHEMWNRVNYIGVVGHDKVSEIYQKAKVGLVLLDYSPNVGYHRGTLGVVKMFEYMMAGIPMVATDFDLWKEIVEGNGCGLCVDPHDVKAVADAINFYIDNPDKAREAGERGRKAVMEKYNWSKQEETLLGLYRQLTD